jgi:hypothetical protein
MTGWFNILLAQQSVTATQGFLPTRGSWMLDFVFVAMFAIVPLLLASVYLVRVRRQYSLHQRLQSVLALVLLVAVAAFEIDMRFFTDWEELAAPSPYFQPDQWCPVWIVLAIHLCFAVPTPLIWGFVLVRAWRHFPHPATPAAHSRSHRLWGWVATWAMILTAVTGWIFFWMAFIA